MSIFADEVTLFFKFKALKVEEYQAAEMTTVEIRIAQNFVYLHRSNFIAYSFSSHQDLQKTSTAKI